MSVNLRSERPEDVPAIEALTAAAFLDAPHSSHTEHFIVNALRRAGQLTVSRVAEIGGVLVGHVAVSPVTITDGSAGWYGLGPVSVLPAQQRRGIGSRLVADALQLLRAQGAAGCVVLGEPGFYGRFGFRAVPELVLPEVPQAYFQALAFTESRPRGSVAYHTAFQAQA
jgi:putative acetyltransferase